jgi:hypothetical protein
LLTPQIPAVQIAVPLAPFGHTVVQLPQWSTFWFKSASQPLTTLASQLAKFALQLMVQFAASQAAVPLVVSQVLLQLPQWAALVCRFDSQPSAGLLLQSAQLGWQLAIEQAPLVQAGVALGRLQTVAQAPQWLGSLLTAVSHPLLGSPSQSANPLAQVGLQFPAVQVEVPWSLAHEIAQVPQWSAVLARSVSQPSFAFWLQLPHPELQLIKHWPALQEGVPLAVLHLLPHPPQFKGSRSVLVSQPSATPMLQSAYPALQSGLLQTPFLHTSGTSQALLQTPQLALLESRSTSQPSLYWTLQSP